MQDTLTPPGMRPEARPDVRPAVSAFEAGLGAWASAISADDNAQAAIALAEAINRARNAQSTRENRASDARIIAVGRLETLRARLAPVYAAIPRDVELFDLGMVGHDPPRLFVDIIAFVELVQDGKGFRLMQETRAGRLLIGETADEKQMVGLVTTYIAERLVERERALAARSIYARSEPLPKATLPAPIAAQPPSPDPIPAPGEAATTALPGAGEAGVTETSAGTPAPPGEKRPVQTAAAAMPAKATAPPAAQEAPVTDRRPASHTDRDRNGGGWFWPVFALFIGMCIGALALYLYAASLARL